MWFLADTTGTNGPPSFNVTNGTNGGMNGTHPGFNGTHINGTHPGFNGTHVNGTHGAHGTNGTNGTHTPGHSLCIKQSTPICAQNDTATGSTYDGLTSKWNITQRHFYRLNDDVNHNCTNLVPGQTVRFFLPSLWSEIFVLLVCLFTDSSLRLVLRCDQWVSSWQLHKFHRSAVLALNWLPGACAHGWKEIGV
jgi:hypothetical protein